MKKTALRYNHIGYAPLAPKYFLAVETSFSSFEVLDELNEVVYSGELISREFGLLQKKTLFLAIFLPFKKMESTELL